MIPVTGRWASRDPIGERGAVNVYSFVEEDPTGKCDVLGLATILTPRVIIAPSSGQYVQAAPGESAGLFYFDSAQCILFAKVRLGVRFMSDGQDPPWTADEKETWLAQAVERTERTFARMDFRCCCHKSSCPVCPGGVKVRFSMEATEQARNAKSAPGVIETNVWKQFHGGLREITLWHPQTNQPIISLSQMSVEERSREMNVPYPNEATKMHGTFVQIALVHEVGHGLGLREDLYDLESPSTTAIYREYLETEKQGIGYWENLMARGDKLWPSQYTRAFCRHIKTGNADCDPWQAK